VEYFCYISRSKIDQLFQDVSPDVDRWVERESKESRTESKVDAGLSLGSIIKLFGGGITYGRKGVIQREKEIKVRYRDKLRAVLVGLAKKAPIPSFETGAERSIFDSPYYVYKGDFTVSSPVPSGTPSETVVTLESHIRSYTLLLDCSLRFFSEGNEPDDTFHIHSGNARFFSGSMDLALETVFMFLRRDGTNVYGTPLYLKLDPAGDHSTSGIDRTL